MKKLFIFLVLIHSIYADTIVLTQKDKEIIKQSFEPYPRAKRFSNLYKFIDDTKHLSLNMKLEKTNYFINKILPKYDNR